MGHWLCQCDFFGNLFTYSQHETQAARRDLCELSQTDEQSDWIWIGSVFLPVAKFYV